MRAPILSLAAIALLTACSTAQERAAYKADPATAMAPQYGPDCEKMGYVKGSDQWRNCILSSSVHHDLGQWALFYDRYPPQRGLWNTTP